MKTIISGILIVAGLCLAGSSAPEMQTQIAVNGGGIISLGAGCFMMTQNDKLNE